MRSPVVAMSQLPHPIAVGIALTEDRGANRNEGSAALEVEQGGPTAFFRMAKRIG